MKTISCLGSGSGKPGDAYYDAMTEIGRLLAQKGCAVACGGFGGAGMEAPAKGADEAGGKSIGYTAFGKAGNKYLSKVIDCSKMSPIKEIQFGLRLGNLLQSDGFIISAGGGPGTMVELMAIINSNYKLWKDLRPVAILKLNDLQIGWDNQMLEQLEKWGVLLGAIKSIIAIVKTPEEAVKWATDTKS